MLDRPSGRDITSRQPAGSTIVGSWPDRYIRAVPESSATDRDIAAWRREYADRGLRPVDLGPDPVAAFSRWLDDAGTAGVHEPNAMVVATIGPDGPSARTVLLKGLDARGFAFYTNLQSRKATELEQDPRCALLFPWHMLERQVRVEGVASRLPDADSDRYFATRPRGSQLGAWASPQSEVVASRDELDERYALVSDRFATIDEVPRPPHWGGIVVRPHRVEFWQGRPGRMHDRVRFERIDEVDWSVERLAP